MHFLLLSLYSCINMRERFCSKYNIRPISLLAVEEDCRKERKNIEGGDAIMFSIWNRIFLSTAHFLPALGPISSNIPLKNEN